MSAAAPERVHETLLTVAQRRARPATEEERAALEVARNLARAGFPVFVARAVAGVDGMWDPTGGTGGHGYRLPSGWQTTRADASVIDAWRPGDALGLVGGHGLDVLDVDPRDGGDETAAALAAAGVWPTVLGRAATPSGGRHDLVNALGLGTSAGVVGPGVDVRAGLPDGTGRGFVWLAPTVRTSKVDGTVRAYTWTTPPILEEVDPADDSGAALAEQVRSRTSSRRPAAVALAPSGPLPWEVTGLDDAARERVRAAHAAEGARRLQWALDCLDEVAHLVEGEHPGGLSWEDADRVGAYRRLVEVVRTPWAQQDGAAVVTGLAGRGWPAAFVDYVHRKAHAHWDAVGPLAPPDGLVDAVAVPLEAPAVGASAAPARTTGGRRGKGEPREAGPSAEDVVDHVTTHYDLVLTPDGSPYAVPKAPPRLAIALGAKAKSLGARVAAHLFNERRVIVEERTLAAAMGVVVAQALAQTETTTLHLRSAPLPDGRLVIDLGQPGSSACVVVTSDGWTVEDTPPPGTLMRRTGATRALPMPVRGGSLEPLREVLGFAADEPAWLLARGWLVAAVFTDIPRPLLLMLGAPGAAKTTRGRLLLNVLDPREQLGSSFGRNLDDDQVKALGRLLLGYDNLTSVSEAVSDHVCRMVTGDSAEKRRQYTDDEAHVLTYRRTGVVTAVTLPALRSDALERVIPVHLERIAPAERTSERKIEAAFAAAHPAILGGLLDALVGTLRRLPALVEADPPGPRMLDYWLTLKAYDETCARAYEAATSSMFRDAAEDDPFVSLVRSWLRASGGAFRGTPAEAYERASAHRGTSSEFSAFDNWWPKRPAELTKALTRAVEPLRAVGIEVRQVRTRGARLLEMRLTEDDEA